MSDKYLVDTCGWVEWLTDGALVDAFSPYLKQLTHLIVPTLVQFELFKWISLKKDSATALEIIALTEQAKVETLDTYLTMSAVDFSLQYQLAMADSIIYATAQKCQVEIITCDQHFKNLPGVKYFPKKK